MSVIYRLRNKCNNKFYFGQTVDLKRREKEYFRYGRFSNDHLKNSFNKYGKENFEFDVMFECPEEMLDVCEELLIYLLDTQNPDKGYNKDAGGNSNRNRSEETLKKMSESKKGSKNPNWRDDLDNDEIVDLFVNQDKTEAEIADLLNTSSTAIHKRLVKMGVDTSKNRFRDDLDNDEIVDLFVNQDKTEAEIGKILNASQTAIHKRLVKMGVDTSKNKHRRRRDLDNDEIVDLFVNQDKTEAEIADLLNASSSVIHNRLVKMGVDTSKNRFRDDLDNDEIVDLYVNQDKTETEIADLLNASSSVIHNRLVKMGVDTSKNKHRSPSKETRKKMSESAKGSKNHNWCNDIDTNLLVEEYFENGLNCHEIGEKYNISSNMVYSRLKSIGCNLRSKSEIASGENNSQAKYTLWDITKCEYNKGPMFQHNRRPNPCKCFYFKYGGETVKIGGFIDFVTPKIIADLTEKFSKKVEVV